MELRLGGWGHIVVADGQGDFTGGKEGYYAWDTRLVSRLRTVLDGREPSVAWGGVTGPRTAEIWLEDAVLKKIVLGKRGLRLLFVNEGVHPVSLKVSYQPSFESIFEVRGSGKLGRRVEADGDGGTIVYTYRGVDGVVRGLRVSCRGCVAGKGVVRGVLRPGGRLTVLLEPYVRHVPQWLTSGLPANPGAVILTDWPELSYLVRAAELEVGMLTLPTKYGPFPLAGIPDFACIFGRDSIITSLFLLPYNPMYARATLYVLTRVQGKRFSEQSYEEPGKIPHEVRWDELSLSGRTVYSRFYGSVDATPLYIHLAAEYLRRSGEERVVRELGDGIAKALDWLAERTRDGMLTYDSKGGVVHHGWKDSANSIVDEDGRVLEDPVALVEVQGYVAMAFRDAVGLADLVGWSEREARRLYTRFVGLVEEFWSPRGYYSMAIGGGRRGGLGSNQGHLLYSGVGRRAEDIVRSLFRRDMFSGWGIRTLSSLNPAFKHDGYHVGSVWPHDNALVLLGLSMRGFRPQALLLAHSLVEAGFMLGGFPELFSGLPRLGNGPLPIGYANRPQAWSSAAVYAIATALLATGGGRAGDGPTFRLKAVVWENGVRRTVVAALPARHVGSSHDTRPY